MRYGKKSSDKLNLTVYDQMISLLQEENLETNVTARLKRLQMRMSAIGINSPLKSFR